MHQETFEAADSSLYKRICGYKDKNLKQIEKYLGVTLIPRGNTIIIQSEEEVSTALKVLNHLAEYLAGREPDSELDDFEVRYIISAVNSDRRIRPRRLTGSRYLFRTRAKRLFPAPSTRLHT